MSFDPEERALFAGLADVLIPAADGMPAASQADAGVSVARSPQRPLRFIER